MAQNPLISSSFFSHFSLLSTPDFPRIWEPNIISVHVLFLDRIPCLWMQHHQFWNIKRLPRSKGEWPIRATVELLLCLKLVKDVLKCFVSSGPPSATWRCSFRQSQLQGHVEDALLLFEKNMYFLSIAVEMWKIGKRGFQGNKYLKLNRNT